MTLPKATRVTHKDIHRICEQTGTSRERLPQNAARTQNLLFSSTYLAHLVLPHKIIHKTCAEAWRRAARPPDGGGQAATSDWPAQKLSTTIFLNKIKVLSITHSACAQYCPQFLCRRRSLSPTRHRTRQFFALAQNLSRVTFAKEIKDLLSSREHCQQFYQQFMCRTEHGSWHRPEHDCKENAQRRNAEQYQGLAVRTGPLLTILSTENVKKRTDEAVMFRC